MKYTHVVLVRKTHKENTSMEKVYFEAGQTWGLRADELDVGDYDIISSYYNIKRRASMRAGDDRKLTFIQFRVMDVGLIYLREKMFDEMGVESSYPFEAPEDVKLVLRVENSDRPEDKGLDKKWAFILAVPIDTKESITE